MIATSLRSENCRRVVKKSATPLHIPVYGSIPAGFPDRREQEPECHLVMDLETLGLPKPSARVFALRVKGDSMVNAGILDGDFAIVQHGLEPKPGDIVSAYIDGKCTLKRFVVVKGKPMLEAENPRFTELVPREELVIQGVVIAVYRRTRQ